MRILDSPSADVHQAGDLVVVHDEATNRLIEVDTRAFNVDLEPTVLPEFSRVYAVEDAVIVVTTDPLSVWRVPAVELATLQTLDLVNPVQVGSDLGSVAVRADGTIGVVDLAAQVFTWHFTDGHDFAIDLDSAGRRHRDRRHDDR